MLKPHLVTRRFRLARLSALLLFGAALSGCVSDRAHFVPVRNDAQHRDGGAVRTRYMVPVDSGASGLYLHSEARTFKDAISEDIAFPTLHVRVWVHNASDAQVEARLSEFEATLDGDTRTRFSRGRFRGESTTIVRVGSRQRAQFDVFFTLPNDYDVTSPSEMTMRWAVRIGQSEYRQTTVFERASNRSFLDPFLSMPMGN